MGATCEPCDYSPTEYETDNKRILHYTSSSSIEGEQGDDHIAPVAISIPTRSLSNEDISPVPQDYLSPDNLRVLTPSNTSMSLITSVCAFLEAPEQIEAESSMDEGDLADIVSDALEFQQKTLRQTANVLVPLKGWLQKKQNAAPHSWQRRYVVVSDDYLLWSDREMTINEGITERERKRWSKCVKLSHITDVILVQSKKERKFQISIKNESRCYLWRASCKKERDYWVNGLSEYKEYTRQKSLFRFMDT